MSSTSLIFRLSVSNFAQTISERICMKFSAKAARQWANKKRLNFGADLGPICQMAELISQHWYDVPWRRYALTHCF